VLALGTALGTAAGTYLAVCVALRTEEVGLLRDLLHRRGARSMPSSPRGDQPA